MHLLVSWLKERSSWFGRVVDGTPVVIFEHGQWHSHRMRTLRVQKTDVMTDVRQRGLQALGAGPLRGR